MIIGDGDYIACRRNSGWNMLLIITVQKLWRTDTESLLCTQEARIAHELLAIRR